MLHDFSASASRQDGRYPRPQLVRPHWTDLTGTWGFAFDPEDAGVRERWQQRPEKIAGEIVVPFPPESTASGIGDTLPQRVLWYRRTVSAEEIAGAGHGADRELLLHFGAVDHRADVWIDGEHVGRHEGGHTPFTVVAPHDTTGFEIVVRAEDDPRDLSQPRGKQDWEPERHVVWYDRTSGIWQPVWLESVPRQHIRSLTWRADPGTGIVRVDVELSNPPAPGTRLAVALQRDEVTVVSQTTETSAPRTTILLSVPELGNGQALDSWLWSPEHPNLLDATIELTSPDEQSDLIASYLGVRSIGTGGGHFLLNDRPYPVHAVLSQGYWPRTHLAAPSADALRAEVQLIKDLGFTSVRVHQKIEDPRFLYWADRLGVLVWSEMPSVYEYTDLAVERLTREWAEMVRRDLSHPSIAVWVPLNESWGVDRIARNPQQRELARALYHLTRSLDDTRLVVSNDGWEHIRSDLFTVHDYENDVELLRARYATAASTEAALQGIAANGRRMLVGTDEEREATAAQPVVLSEFGGVSIDSAADGAWGYRLVDSRESLEEHLDAMFSAVHAGAGLAGWCYTQLTDTAQETNGLVDEDRVPKIPLPRLRALIAGTPRPRPAEPVFRIEALDG